MKAPWPLVVVVCGALAVGGVVWAYWDRVDHAAVDARHAAALAELKSDDIEVRIDGVNKLEQVTKDSRFDQPVITSELSAFIRSVAGSRNCRDYQVGRDVQAALNVLVRRNTPDDQDTVVDLHGACLRNAVMAKIDLVYADLSGADLGDANLNSAVLDGADLTGTNFADADLTDAQIVDARTELANLSGANVSGMDGNYSR